MVNIAEVNNRLFPAILEDAEILLTQIYNVLTLAIDNADGNRNKIRRDAQDFTLADLLLGLSRRVSGCGCWRGR